MKLLADNKSHYTLRSNFIHQDPVNLCKGESILIHILYILLLCIINCYNSGFGPVRRCDLLNAAPLRNMTPRALSMRGRETRENL